LILITLYNEDYKILQEQNDADRGRLRPEDEEEDVRSGVSLCANVFATLDLRLLISCCIMLSYNVFRDDVSIVLLQH
jgi:hypothetical protein